MVYLLIANKPYKYKSGRLSHVIYIGTTGKGAHRPATSAVDKGVRLSASCAVLRRFEYTSQVVVVARQ
jgi:hypothetical protein